MASDWNRKRLRFVSTTAGLLAIVSVAASAQGPVPVQGTIALEGTVRSVYRAANTVIVATLDGVEHTYHFTKDLLVHGGKGKGPDALAGLENGSSVVLHYTTSGDAASAVEIDRIGADGLKMEEGVVTHVDRKRDEITIRFPNKTTETLRLTARAAAEAGDDVDRAAAESATVVIYYSDEGGQKVAHFFKRAK